MILSFLRGAAAVAVVAATTVTAPAADPPLAWQPCDGGTCATLSVPLDWADPNGPRTTIGLGKLDAVDPAHKRGTLLVNTGGPGAQMPYMAQFARGLADLRQWFDIVLFDPRGFGTSAGITCPTEHPLPADLAWAAPVRTDFEAYAAANRRYVEDCAPAIGPLAGHLNSWQVAHDMDAIRAALGQERLDYFGNSYGTVFGQAYLELFGKKTGRMYLDSVLDHTTPDFAEWAGRTAPVDEQNLRAFAQWCAKDTSCALHGRDVPAVWDHLLATAREHPIPAPGAGPGAVATHGYLVSSLFLIVDQEWPRFASAIAEADAGDATAFRTIPRGPNDLGTPQLMFCADFPYRAGYDLMARTADDLRATAPHLGWRSAWNLSASVHCAGLDQPGTFAPHPLEVGPVPAVLLAGGERDTTTPPAGGQQVAAQLPGSRFVLAQGGHARYLAGNTCVRDIVHRYLTAGELPREGTYCAA